MSLVTLLQDKKYHAHPIFYKNMYVVDFIEKMKSPTFFLLNIVPSYLTKAYYRYNYFD